MRFGAAPAAPLDEGGDAATEDAGEDSDALADGELLTDAVLDDAEVAMLPEDVVALWAEPQPATKRETMVRAAMTAGLNRMSIRTFVEPDDVRRQRSCRQPAPIPRGGLIRPTNRRPGSPIPKKRTTVAGQRRIQTGLR